jgi:hypothetical protein
MDPFEKKLKDFYREKKQEDEKHVPDLNTLLNTPIRARTNTLSDFFLKIAAAILVVAGSASYYFYNSPNHAAISVREIPGINLARPFPSEVLLKHGTGADYIWEWKAPTDKLLDDVNESVNRIKNPNL